MTRPAHRVPAHSVRAFAAFALWLAAAPPAASADALLGLQWFEPARLPASLDELKPEYPQRARDGQPGSPLLQLGRLLYRDPALFGGNARKLELSCQSCHPGGGANTEFFFEGVSDRPGNVDLTHAFWNPAAGDGEDNPRNIPSLRGVGATAPYGHGGRFGTLRDFIRNVIVVEFSGAEPMPVVLDALTTYVRGFAPPPNDALGPGGLLGHKASRQVTDGERLFRARCAACHAPTSLFQDGRRHDIGTGGTIDTPTLTGLGATAPYFHDGSAPGLETAIARHSLPAPSGEVTGEAGLSRDEISSLEAYLNIIGKSDLARAPLTLQGDLAFLSDGLALLGWALRHEKTGWIVPVGGSLRHHVGAIHARFDRPQHEPARRILADWARAIRRIAELFEARDYAGARAGQKALADEIEMPPGALLKAASTSLYDGDRLREAATSARGAGAVGNTQ